MTTFDRSAYAAPSASAAAEADARMRGDVLRLKPDLDYYLRFMPAFAQRDGRGIWWSMGKRHYKIPGANTESKHYTYDCPQYAMVGRCIVCEHEDQFRAVDDWDGREGKKGKLHVRFNVIDAKNPAAGVQTLEDTITLHRMLTAQLERNSSLMDPADGKVIGVNKLPAAPWRQFFDADIEGAQPGGFCSLDVLHEDAFEWAKLINLPNLEESWNYPTEEKQLEVFTGGVIRGIGGGGDSAGSALPPPAPAPAPEAIPQVPESTETPSPAPAPAEQGQVPSVIVLALQKAQKEKAEADAAAAVAEAEAA